MKAVRYGLIGLAGLVVLLLAGVAAGYAWLQSAGGRQWLASTIEGAASGPDMTLTLGAIEGGIPFDLTVASAEVADSQGRWLSLQGLHIRLSPGALLARRVSLEALEAARIEVVRAPVGTRPPQPEPADERQSASLLPQLPVGIEVRRLAVDELRLGEALLGEPAVLRIGGDARLERGGGGLDSHLRVDRIDDKPGQAVLAAAFDPARNRLDLDLKASEPEGGVIARTLSIPGLPPVTVTLDGAGPLDDWKGALVAEAQGRGRLTADAAVRRIADGHAVTLTAGGDLPAVLAGSSAALVGPDPALNATVVVAPDGGLALRPVALRAAAGTASLTGTVSADHKRLALTWEAAAGPDSALHGMTSGLSWREGMASGSVEGTLDDLAVALTAVLRDVAAGDAALSPVAGPEVRLELRSRMDTGKGDVRIGRLALDAAGAKAGAEGQVGGWGQTADLALSLVADDLSKLSALAGRPLGGALSLKGPVRRGATARSRPNCRARRATCPPAPRPMPCWATARR
ncbi:hypothetical protein [Azospirillum thermophilum]|uniref:hypothetical protein n=1 Tax=Azospirillum thermophilum TaxID=2202148 RepID=UPI001FE5B8FB|nr:hypothetical protein [Azospirillum thermophilum]